MSTFFVRWGEEFFEEANYYAEKLLCTPIFFGIYRIPWRIGFLGSGFRGVSNRSKVYPPLAGLPAVFLVRSPSPDRIIHM
jgi:hypothetical protein